MATILNADFEGGTLGAAVSISNSPFTQYVQPGWTFVNSPLLASGGGSLAARCIAGGTSNVIANAPITATPIVYLRFYMYVSTRPTGNFAVAQLLGTDNLTVRAELQLGANGQFRIRDSAFLALATSPSGSAPVSGWCRVEWRFDNTALRQQLRIYNGADLHGTTPTYDSGSLTIPAAGTAGYILVGSTSTAAVMTHVWDNVKADNSTWVGTAFVAEPAPVADAGVDQIVDSNTATTFTLNGTASTGTITSSQWDDMTSGSAVAVPGTGLTRTITAQKLTTDTTHNYRLTVTGASGSTTDTVNVIVSKYRSWRMDGTTLVPRKRQATVAGDITPPTTPGTPVATAGAGTVTVTTSGSTDAEGVTAYEWYRNGAATPVATTTGTSLTQNGLTPDVPVYYRVRARDAAGNWSAESLASNTVTPTSASSGLIIYGVCPHNSGGVSGALSKWYTTRPIAMRVFSGGGIDGAIPTRPTGIGVLHYSYKPGSNATFTRAQIVRACTNLVDGDILEVEHEHDNDADVPGKVVTKQNFAAAVRSAREAGAIPNVLTCDTFTGWAFSSTNGANQDAKYGGSDLLGSDWDGIDPIPYDNFSVGYPVGSPLYVDFYALEYAETVAYMNKWGYQGWCIPEFSTFRHPTSDASGTTRVGWMNQQIGKINAAPVKPYYVAFFDFSNRPTVADHLECLELTNEINAWKAAIATNPLA